MTPSELQAHVKSGKTVEATYYSHRLPAKRLTCADGFYMSVQASATHYCDPRDDDGPYTTFEIGFPSQAEPTLMPYCEDTDRPTETVYAHVPLDVVLALINSHGGAV